METISDDNVIDLSVKKMNPFVEVSHCCAISNSAACSGREEAICPPELRLRASRQQVCARLGVQVHLETLHLDEN